MTTIYLIRHAAAEGNLFHRIQGHYDSTVTDRGYLQIAALHERFSKTQIDAVYTSDLFRAQTTALTLTLPRRMEAIPRKELREICFGVWENEPRAKVRHDTPEQLALFDAYDARWQVRDGERIVDALERVHDALKKIAEENPGRTVAVVSHGHVLQMLTGRLLGIPPERIASETVIGKNASVTKVEADASGMRVLYRDDASHLTHLLAGKNAAKAKKPEIYFAPLSPECALVMHGDAPAGKVCVRAADGQKAWIETFTLSAKLINRGVGVQLLGQAVTMARAQGCDTLLTELPHDNEIARRRAMQYGFAPVRETETGTVWEKYFGYSDQHRLDKLDAAMKLLRQNNTGE